MYALKNICTLLLVCGCSFAYSAGNKLISNGKEKIYSTPAKALAKAKSGDTVIIADGFWEGGLKMTVPNVTLKGSRNTIICAGKEIRSNAWKPAPEAGKNAWKTPWSSVPANVVCNGRALLELHSTNGSGAQNYKEIMKYGVASTGRVLLGGIFSYDRKNKMLTVSLPDVKDISKCRIFAANRGRNALTIAADKCVVSDLTLLGGDGGAVFSNCDGSEVHHILAVANNNGIMFTGNSRNCSAHHCDVTLNPDSYTCNARFGPSSAVWDVWLAHKRVGSWDKTGIAIFWAGRGNKIFCNTVYNHWNGIHCGTDPKTWNRGLKEYYYNHIVPQKGRVNQQTCVFNNRVDLCIDDALEPAGDVENQQWYSNVVTRAHCGIRIKTVDIGPLYIYDNDVSDCLDGIRFFKNLTEPAKVYVIHNRLKHRAAHTFAAVDTIPLKGVLGDQVPGGIRGARVFNNLYLTDSYTIEFPKKGTAMFTSDHNAYICARPQELAPELEQNSRFKLDIKGTPAVCKDVPAKKLNITELPYSARGKYAGLLNIAPEKTPKTFVSGRYDNAAKLLDMRVRPWSFSKLAAHSFVMAPEQTYILRNPSKLSSAKILLRAYLEPKIKTNGFKVIFSDGEKIIAEKQMKFLAVSEIDVPLAGLPQVTMKIVSKNRKAAWSIESLVPEVSCKLVVDKKLDIVSVNNCSTISLEVAPPANHGDIRLLASGVQGSVLSWISPEGKQIKFSENISADSGTWKLVSKNSRKLQLAPAGDRYPLISTPITENIAPGITLRPPSEGFAD